MRCGKSVGFLGATSLLLAIVAGCDGDGPQAPAPTAADTPANPFPDSDLYGPDQGGEPILPADTTAPGALLRAHRDDSFYKITGARIETNRPGFPALIVDYELVREGKFHGVSVVLQPDRGPSSIYLVLSPMTQRGSFTLEQRVPNFNGPAFPDDMEIYFIRSDPRYGAKTPTFKVSNSFIRGKVASTTPARDWRPEEAEMLASPPPAYSSPGDHPDVGEDTEFAGDVSGGGSFRYVEPEGHLLGVDYWDGEWDGEECLSRLNPVFDRDQPSTGPNRELARAGYAVGGLRVRVAGKFVDAAQVVYMKLKPDGSLDPTDSYDSKWLGPATEGEVARNWASTADLSSASTPSRAASSIRWPW